MSPARAYNTWMLTRSGVAKRLGKSIATVRRLENVSLHPVRDARGVLRFSEAEVEQVARGQHGRAWQPSRARAQPARDYEGELSERDTELEELRERMAHLEGARAAERRRFAEQLEDAEAQLGRLRREAEERDLAAVRSRGADHGQQSASPAEAAELLSLRLEALETLASLSPLEMRRLSQEEIDTLLELAEGD